MTLKLNNILYHINSVDKGGGYEKHNINVPSRTKWQNIAPITNKEDIFGC